MNDRYHAQPLLAATTVGDEPAAIRVDRAQTELLRGRAIRLTDPADGSPDGVDAGVVALAVEGLTDHRFGWLSSLGASMHLLLTAERAAALGLQPEPSSAEAGSPVLLSLPTDITLDALATLAAVEPATGRSTPVVSLALPSAAQRRVLGAASTLAKNARLMPALLVVEPPPAAAPRLATAQLLSVSVADVQSAQGAGARRLRRVSDAQVPIEAHEDCELVLFREDPGGAEHVAIIVGQPDFGQPMPVRLHSACLTGDLLGSLRCDCGDQLRRSIARLAETGGVLLYLQQEGRSIGLANKLRAYRLQDDGLDTIDADRYLGFLADERDYAPALAMLQSLGIRQVRLLTNNPRKIAAIEAGGIEVVERLALHGPVNRHNARYIETKQERAGHLKSD